MNSDDQARIAARYPKRSLVDYAIGAIAALSILGAIGLAVSTGVTQSNPPVVAMVRSFKVVSPTEITAQLVVQRKNPADPVECKVNAQAQSYEKVAEEVITVPPGKDALTPVDINLKTIKEATTLTIDACRVVG